MAAPTLTTVSFFHYRRKRDRWWAFTQMQFAHAPLGRVPGLRFYKLMGSGAGTGFSLRPDWGTYCLLGVWENAAAAARFFAKDVQYAEFERRSEVRTFHLEPVRKKGSWDGGDPFELGAPLQADEKLAVLTRAGIRTSRLYEFWQHVPESSRAIVDRPGLLFSKGVGELPVVQQATLSVWENREAMLDFAYRDKTHREIIQKTHRRGWYHEEMFVEFRVLGMPETVD